MARCDYGFERYTVQGWSEGSSPSSLQVDNRDGATLIALGPLDTTGAVVIRPTASNFTSAIPFVVAAGCPFVGLLEGPFTVTPYATGVVANRFSTLTILDLVMFRDPPPWYQAAREPLSVSKTFATTLDGANGGNLVVNVRGRKRIAVSVVQGAGSGTANDFDVQGYQFLTTAPGGAVIATAIAQTVSLSASAGFSRQFNDQVGLGGTFPGVTVLDSVQIYTTSAVWTGNYYATVQAWD